MKIKWSTPRAVSIEKPLVVIIAAAIKLIVFAAALYMSFS